MYTIRILDKPTLLTELGDLAKETYVSLLKGSVDIEQKRVALGGEWHIDSCEVLTQSGSNKDNVWGFNIVFTPADSTPFSLEYHSLINIKPTKGHRAMEVTDPALQTRMRDAILPLLLS